MIGGFPNGPERRRRLADIQQVVDALRTDVQAPDLTDSILSRVHQQRPFVDSRTRRLIIASRLGLSASIAVAVLGVILVQRVAPRATLIAEQQPQPLSDVVCVAGSSAAAGLQTLRAGYEQVSAPASSGTMVPMRFQGAIAPRVTAVAARTPPSFEPAPIRVVPINRLGSAVAAGRTAVPVQPVAFTVERRAVGVGPAYSRLETCDLAAAGYWYPGWLGLQARPAPARAGDDVVPPLPRGGDAAAAIAR